MELEYGKGSLEIPIDQERIIGTLQPRSVQGIERVEEVVRESLEKPVESPPLSEIMKGKEKVLILTVNFTRPSPKALIHPKTTFNEALEIAERHAGKKSRITVLKKARKLIIN